MDYNIIFTIETGGQTLHTHLTPELKRLSRERSTVEASLKGEKLVFDIKATDFTSLKATITSIINSIDIFEKTKDLVENEQGN